MPTIPTTPYTSISFPQMLKAVRWCQNALNLRDWTIDLEVGDVVPKWVDKDENDVLLAFSRSWASYFTAQIWICPSCCKDRDCHPISVLCHEMIHVFLQSYRICDNDERMINTLEYHLFKSWLIDVAKRKMKGRK